MLQLQVLSFELRLVTLSYASPLRVLYLDLIFFTFMSLPRKWSPFLGDQGFHECAPMLWAKSKVFATKEKFAYPSEIVSKRIARRGSDTHNSADSWTKSVMMNIVDRERKFSWRALNLIISAVRRSLACGSGMIISVPV